MSIFKKNLILFFILIIFVAFYFLYTKKIEKKKERNESIEKNVFSLPENKVSYILIKNNDKEFECFKKNNNWIINNKNFECDNKEIQNLINSIVKIQKEREIGEIDDLDKYGLKEETKKIIIGNSERFSLFIGRDTPTMDFYYATTDKKNIFLVSKEINNILEKDIFDLRDKRIIPAEIKKEEIEKIEIKRGKNIYIIQKEKGKWKIISPINDFADKFKIENIISNIIEGNVKFFVEDNTKKTDLLFTSSYIKLTTKNETFSLFFGKEENEEIYAKNSIRPYIFKIDKKVLNDIPENITDLREKYVFTFSKDEIIVIEIENKNEKFKIIKKENKWEIEGKQEKVLDEKIDEFLDEINSLQINKFIEFSESNLTKYGLKIPEIKITIILKNNDKESLHIGKKDGENIFCFLPERKIIITLPESDYPTLNKSKDDFIKK